MCLHHKPRKISSFFQYLIAALLAIVMSMYPVSWIMDLAQAVSDIYVNILKLVSLPILFLSIVTVASNIENSDAFTQVSKRLVRYTLLTTWIAAFSALILLLLVGPTHVEESAAASYSAMGEVGAVSHGNYLSYLINTIPSNIVQPFAQGNVFGVLLIALMVSWAAYKLPISERKNLHTLFSSVYALFMKMTMGIVQAIPVALWAFIMLFMRDLREGMELHNLGLYLLVIFLANTVQAFVVLPLFLKRKGISPLELFKAMTPALIVAFFTKSSSATVPTAMNAATQRASVSSDVAHVAFPLCTTINMNGCAAFILTTVLFVSQAQGIHFSLFEMIAWTFVATIAAVGNAGVPMGCYFLSSALLASMNVPLTLLGVILPFYALIDAYETAVNIWSDSCVAKMVDVELKEKGPIPANALSS